MGVRRALRALRARRTPIFWFFQEISGIFRLEFLLQQINLIESFLGCFFKIWSKRPFWTTETPPEY